MCTHKNSKLKSIRKERASLRKGQTERVIKRQRERRAIFGNMKRTSVKKRETETVIHSEKDKKKESVETEEKYS